MRTVVASDVVGIFECGAGTDGDRFFADVRVRGTGELAGGVNLHHPNLKVPNQPHSLQHLKQFIFAYVLQLSCSVSRPGNRLPPTKRRVSASHISYCIIASVQASTRGFTRYPHQMPANDAV